MATTQNDFSKEKFNETVEKVIYPMCLELVESYKNRHNLSIEDAEDLSQEVILLVTMQKESLKKRIIENKENYFRKGLKKLIQVAACKILSYRSSELQPEEDFDFESAFVSKNDEQKLFQMNIDVQSQMTKRQELIYRFLLDTDDQVPNRKDLMVDATGVNSLCDRLKISRKTFDSECRTIKKIVKEYLSEQ